MKAKQRASAKEIQDSNVMYGVEYEKLFRNASEMGPIIEEGKR